MFESIIRESPLLSGTVAAVVAILVLLFVSALISGWRGRRKTDSVRREPVLGRRRPDRDEPDRLYGLPRDPDARRRFGSGALAVSFLGGLVVGVGGLAISATGQFGSALDNLVGLIDASLPGTGQAAGLEAPAKAVGATKPDTDTSAPAAPASQSGSPAPDDVSGEVKARLAVFAGKLKDALPREAGPEIALTSVDTAGMTLSLGYTVGRVMPADEIAEFDAYIMRTIKSLFCGKEAQEIRFLNEGGVAFHMVYADPSGETVAKLTVPARFCA